MTYGLSFWIPTAIALFSTSTSIIEAILRQRSEAENEKMMLDILRKLTSKAKRPTKTASAKKQISTRRELDLRERNQKLREEKFNWEKKKDIRDTIYDILDRMG